MKRIKVWISVGLAVFVIILSVLLFVFSFGSGQRRYHSKLSEIEIQIPVFSLFVEEFQDENTYTIQFKMLGSEEHIINELIKIENENRENPIYAIDEWAVNDAGCITKTVILTYVIK